MRPINQRRLNEGFAPLHFLLPPVKAYGFFVKRASADLTEPHVPRRERCEESYPPSESCSLVTYINTDDVELSVNSALLGFWPRESQIELSTLRLNSSRLPISIQNTERDSLIAKSTCRYTKQALTSESSVWIVVVVRFPGEWFHRTILRTPPVEAPTQQGGGRRGGGREVAW